MISMSEKDMVMRSFLDSSIDCVRKKTMNKNHINTGNNYKHSAFPVIIVMYGNFEQRKTNCMLEKLYTSWTNADLIAPVIVNESETEATVAERVNEKVQSCLQAQGRYPEYNKCLIAHIVSDENGNCENYFCDIEKVNEYIKTANVATRLFSAVFAVFSRNNIEKYNELLKAVSVHREKLTDIYMLSNAKQDGHIISASGTELFEIIGNTILLAGSGNSGGNDDSAQISSALLQSDRNRVLQVAYEKAQKPDREIVLVSMNSLLDEFRNNIPSASSYEDVKSKLGVDESSGFLQKYYNDRIKPQLPSDMHILMGSFPFDGQALELLKRAPGRIFNETADKWTYGCWSAFTEKFVKSLAFDPQQCYRDCVDFICSKVTVADIYAHFGNSKLKADIDSDVDYSDHVDYSGDLKHLSSVLSVLFESNIKAYFVENINKCLKRAVDDLYALVHKTVEHVNVMSDFCNRELGIRNQMINQIISKFTSLFKLKKGHLFVNDEQFIKCFVDSSYAGGEFELNNFLDSMYSVMDSLTEATEFQYDFTDEMSFILGEDDKQPQLGTVLKELLVNNVSGKRYFQYNGMSHSLPVVAECVLFNSKTKVNNYKNIFTSASYKFFDNNCVDSIETICFYDCANETQLFLPISI